MKTFTALARAVNLRSGRNNLRKILRQSMRQEWYPALSCIRDREELGILTNPEKHASVIAEWKWFGESIGMDEEEAKRDHERRLKRDAQLCSWHDCQYHSTRAPISLMTCKGCGEVRYCSRHCQRSDWYEGKHKLRCRRLKDA
ncbi:hypothetical protein PENSPDRAFT_440532 [Peniophora sp. CONT]|nr:hypothetical protein PENSPDRAFT_440532 [Peniophora sp. CONT]